MSSTFHKSELGTQVWVDRIRHGRKSALLFRRQRSVERRQGLGIPALSHVSNYSHQQITDQRHILVFLGIGLFIHPGLLQRLLLLAGPDQLHRPFMDPPNIIPTDLERAATLDTAHAFKTSITSRSNSRMKRPRTSPQGTDTTPAGLHGSDSQSGEPEHRDR